MPDNGATDVTRLDQPRVIQVTRGKPGVHMTYECFTFTLMGYGTVAALTSMLRKHAGQGGSVAAALSVRTLRTLRAVLTPGGMCGVAIEAASLATHVMLYPLGATGEVSRDDFSGNYRTDELTPLQRGLMVAAMDTAAMPVVLVHGIADNRSAFALLATQLRRRGFRTVHAVNYSVLTAVTGDIRQAARRLGTHIERICELTGADGVHVVGHSLGGMIARYYVQRLGGDGRVRTLVTLGAPHSGTVAAYLLPTHLARQLRPGSDLLTELAAPAPDCRTRFVAVWSQLDEVVLPPGNARLEHPDLDVEEHLIRDVGHFSLLVHFRVLHTVIAALVRLDQPGRAPLITLRGDNWSDQETASESLPLAPSS